MMIADDCKFLFNERGAKRWLERSRLPSPNAILPLTSEEFPEPDGGAFLRSTDKEALLLTDRLANRLTREFPQDVLPSGFAGPSTVPGDFYSLLNTSGCGMNPLPIPVSNNNQLIESSGLATAIRPADAPYLKELVKLFFGYVAPASLHINKPSSTGFLHFASRGAAAVQYKKLGALKALRNSNEFLDLASGSDSSLVLLANRYHAIYLYAIHERQQPNPIILGKDGFFSKQRPVPTEDEARTGRYTGTTQADMAVRDQGGNVIPGHFAMRRRDVFGMNGFLNYFMTGVFGCFREVYLNRFAFTYKTRDRHDKRRKISQYNHVVGSDVKTMDKMMPQWFLSFVLDELTRYVDDRVVEVLRRMLSAPYVVPPPWIETPATYNPVFGGSPLKVENLKQSVGLPSGIAINPDLGKLWMTFVYSILYRDVGAISNPSDLEPLLRGLNPEHALLDTSDDAAFLTNSAVVAERLRKPKSPYAILEVENPVIYLGDVLCEVDGGKDAFPNPISYFTNTLCPEASISRESTQSWAEGMVARIQVYSANPIFRDINSIYEEECRACLRVNPNLLARMMARRQRFLDVDAMVKANPAVLFFKVDPKDVSPDVLNEVVSTIPAADFFNSIKHLFKVKTVSYEEVSLEQR